MLLSKRSNGQHVCSIIYKYFIKDLNLWTEWSSGGVDEWYLVHKNQAVQRSYFFLILLSHPIFSYFFFKNPTLSIFLVLVSRVLFQNSVNYC